MLRALLTRKGRKGFTLVELAVVIVIVGALAAFGVPRFIQSVERSKAKEAFSYLDAVRSAQVSYCARAGNYASDLSVMDIQLPAPRYFSVPSTVALGRTSDGLRDTWSLMLTRAGASSGYGAYTVTYTQDGYDPAHSTIDGMADIKPRAGHPPGPPASGGS